MNEATSLLVPKVSHLFNPLYSNDDYSPHESTLITNDNYSRHGHHQAISAQYSTVMPYIAITCHRKLYN